MKTIKVTRDGRSLLIFDPCTLCLVYTNIDGGRGEGKKQCFYESQEDAVLHNDNEEKCTWRIFQDYQIYN